MLSFLRFFGEFAGSGGTFPAIITDPENPENPENSPA
jgi:hypothetical protein